MSATEETKFGFIGLGQMGLPMARNLARHLSGAGRLCVFDIVAQAMDQIVQEFPDVVSVCSSAEEVAKQSHVILTMLPEGHHVRSIYINGPNNLLSTDVSDKFLIDCSTIDTKSSIQIKEQLNARYPSAKFYDAPVSGGVIGAVKGTLNFFVGCDESDPNFPILQNILSFMGKKMIACGGPSLGLTSKICNNYLTGILVLASAETFNMGMRAGLDPKLLAQVIAAGTARNMICESFCPVPNVVLEAPSSRGYQGGFRIPLMLKDLNLAMDVAQEVEANRNLGRVATQTFDTASKDEMYKHLDIGSVFKMIGGRVGKEN